jgi:altronate dehydratase small subunit
MPRAIVLNPEDNVATLLDEGRAGDVCILQGERSGEVRLVDAIAFGHKVCIVETRAGGEVRKYGQAIGRTTRAIRIGEHAHVHNIESARRTRLEGR